MSKKNEPVFSALPQLKHWDSSGVEMKPMQQLKYLSDGSEVMDPTPIAPPIGFNPQPSLWEQMRTMYQQMRRQELDGSMDPETIEESDDFDVPDDDVVIPQSPWENERDPSIGELLRAGREALEKRAQAAKEALKPTPAATPTPNPSSVPAGPPAA